MDYSSKMMYNVDMVFCIDATGSMSPIIDMVKKNALNFYGDVVKALGEKQKKISQMRVRVIAFRDYIADGSEAMMATNFFALPQQTAQFEGSINSIRADGGGDEPEDGLEALGYAIRSDWNQEGTKKRHIIVVWTDASTHEIGHARHTSVYPKNMAQSFAELTSWWGDEQMGGVMNNSAKRLILFAPKAPYWEDISSTWNNVIHYPSSAGRGLEELTYKEILNAICNSF